MTNKILIFSATFNEAENIEEFLSTIEHLNLNLDILIIDDYSPDGTWKIIENYSKNKKNIKLIVRNKKEGLDTAHKTAFEYAIDNNYEFLITLDADLSHDPKKIPEFINELKTNSFVIGSRYMTGGKSNYKGYRDFISRLANIGCKFLLRMPFKEYTPSFRAYNTKSLKVLKKATLWSDGYSSQIEFIIFIYISGLKCIEIPIQFHDRTKGNSKIPRLQAFYGALKLLELFIRRLITNKK